VLAGNTALRTSRKIVLILVVVFVEFAWIVRPRISLHGDILDERYRRSERFATLVAKSQHPSPEAEAAFKREVEMLHAYMDRREKITFALLLALNTAGIYWFWHYGNGKTKGQPGAAPNGGPAMPLGGSGAAEGPPSVS
jgi:hypothetical protein